MSGLQIIPRITFMRHCTRNFRTANPAELISVRAEGMDGQFSARSDIAPAWTGKKRQKG